MPCTVRSVFFNGRKKRRLSYICVSLTLNMVGSGSSFVPEPRANRHRRPPSACADRAPYCRPSTYIPYIRRTIQLRPVYAAQLVRTFFQMMRHRRPGGLAGRAARTFSNVLRDRSNVLRSGMADGSSRLDHHAVLLGVPLLLIGSGALLTTLGRTGPRAPAEGSSAAAADPLTEVAETDVTATCDSDEEGGLQVSGGSLEDVYEVGEVLGRGHFAVVTSGRHRVTGETVAIKTIKKGSTNVRSEVGKLRRLANPRPSPSH
jgi:hypothetical protein